VRGDFGELSVKEVDVNAGETVGITGIAGNGQGELV